LGEVYNVGGNNEITNRQITETILREMDKPWDQFVQYVKDRPGHDRRYAIDSSKLQTELGWKPSQTFETGIAQTVDWYLAQQPWVQRVLDGSYRMERLGS
jgi:dTDP-glucose 4,6-dehydratase